MGGARGAVSIDRPDAELLLLRTHVLENAGQSVVTVSDPAYAVPVFKSAAFDAVIFCHLVPPLVRGALTRKMMEARHVPVLVFQKPIALGADVSLRIVGPWSLGADALCRQLLKQFRLSVTSKRHSLQSWKEIATYVGRGVRTVQRWEGLGLPVHRPGNGDKASVFVLVAELEQWMERQ
jgi:hypothetical protein